MKKKKLYTFILILLLVIIYGVMFGFSAQTGEESGGLSFMVSKKLVEFADFFSTADWRPAEIDAKAEMLEFFVRKAAHFSEYAALGVCWCGLGVLWIENWKKMKTLIIGIVFLSGMIDEVHQIFVPGRYPSIWDVLLDTAGGTFGMLLVVFVNRISLRRKKAAC